MHDTIVAARRSLTEISDTHGHGDDHVPHAHDHDEATPRWKHDGVRVIPGDRLTPNTAQTPGMFRQAAVNAARVGAQKIWAGTVAVEPDAKTGEHHHGALESVICIVSGRARMRWGERLEYVAEAGPGDFVFAPSYVPHQEIDASTDEPLRGPRRLLDRSDPQGAVTVPGRDGPSARLRGRFTSGGVNGIERRRRPVASNGAFEGVVVNPIRGMR